MAEVPRVKCSKHGVKQVAVPWAEAGSSFTELSESLPIDWLKKASTLAVSRRLNQSWDEVDGIMQRAVKRGLARRKMMYLRENRGRCMDVISSHHSDLDRRALREFSRHLLILEERTVDF